MPPLVSAIAKEAFIYGYPMVMNYGNMFAYAIARANPQYKAPFNEIANDAKIFTSQNTTVTTPNLDTPYSTLWADLRAQPLILGVPTVDPHRYYSIMFVDLYTWNFAYVGTRTTGNGAGYFLLAGPGWDGVVPTGITKVIRADTDFVFIVYRTQLFNFGRPCKRQGNSVWLHGSAAEQIPGSRCVATFFQSGVSAVHYRAGGIADVL